MTQKTNKIFLSVSLILYICGLVILAYPLSSPYDVVFVGPANCKTGCFQNTVPFGPSPVIIGGILAIAYLFFLPLYAYSHTVNSHKFAMRILLITPAVLYIIISWFIYYFLLPRLKF